MTRSASTASDGPRRILLLTHTGRPEARDVSAQAIAALTGAGLTVRLPADEAAEVGVVAAPGIEIVPAGDAQAAAGCELAVVLGGDGTILRAAELTHLTGTPLLGVNLGHVGFLAEAESEDLEATIEAITARHYAVEERLTLDVQVLADGQVVYRTWALNEATLEKAARQRMLDVVMEVDGRPVSRFGCDGVVCATPTGSTAYNFSAGGPIVWPSVDALVLVPISAHALFARPMVIAPSSTVAVEVLPGDAAVGVLWCDGRRSVDLAPGARVEIRRGARPVRLARLHEAPFTDRLVAKFELPVSGWRGGRSTDDRGGAARTRPRSGQRADPEVIRSGAGEPR